MSKIRPIIYQFRSRFCVTFISEHPVWWEKEVVNSIPDAGLGPGPEQYRDFREIHIWFPGNSHLISGEFNFDPQMCYSIPHNITYNVNFLTLRMNFNEGFDHCVSKNLHFWLQHFHIERRHLQHKISFNMYLKQC